MSLLANKSPIYFFNTNKSPICFAVLMAASVLLLSSCGFRPMYGDNSRMKTAGVQAQLNEVAIGIIPDREGQMLRNALMDRFYAGAGEPTSPRFTLTIAPITEQRFELDITKTAEATRAQLNLTSTLTLKDMNGKILITRPLRSITSYNVLESEFATRVTETAARENAIQDLARQIERDVALYVTR
jgi:LPS-assembly lipoprotein